MKNRRKLYGMTKHIRMRNKIVKILSGTSGLTTKEIVDALSIPKKPATLPSTTELNNILSRDTRINRVNKRQPALWELRVSHVENLQEV